jgi:methionyl-tRNA formyltransferase
VTKLEIIFFGSPYYSIPLLEKIISLGHVVSLVVTQGAKKNRRGKLVNTPIYEYCKKNNIQCITPSTLDENIFSDSVIKNVDLGFIYAYGKIIPKEIIKKFKTGIMNLHCSLLPNYRGAAPVQHAIMNNEQVTGITFFEINEKLDDGKIILTEEYTIKELDDCMSVQDSLTSIAVKNCQEAIELMCKKNFIGSPPLQKINYARKISKEDGILHWGMSVRSMYNKIRALNIWPIARIDLYEEQIKILRAKCTIADHKFIPGQVIKFDKNELVIAASEGFLSIEILQLEGKQAISSRDLFNSHAKLKEKIINAKLNI